MTGCRNCEQLTSGDCGAHGPVARAEELARACAGPMLCGHPPDAVTALSGRPAYCRWCAEVTALQAEVAILRAALQAFANLPARLDVVVTVASKRALGAAKAVARAQGNGTVTIKRGHILAARAALALSTGSVALRSAAAQERTKDERAFEEK